MPQRYLLIAANPLLKTATIMSQIDPTSLDRQRPPERMSIRSLPWPSRAGLSVAIDMWRSELALDDMLVSPLLVDLHGLGPLTVFSGTRDITNPDTRLLVDKVRSAGGTVDYHEGPGLIHLYPLLFGPEAKAARSSIVETLRRLS